MKSRTSYLSLLALSLGLAQAAQAEYYIGSDNVVYGLADASVTYDSNIFTNNTELDDIIYSITPGVQFIRDAGHIRTEVEAGVLIERYDDFSQFDTEDPYGLVRFTMPFRDENYPLAVRARAEYRKETLSDATVLDRVERDRMEASARADYRVHRRFQVSTTLTGESYDYDQERFYDTTVVGLETRGGYRYSDNLNLGLSGRIRETDRDVWDATDYAFFATAEGQLLPRTTGEVSVGAQYRDYSDNVMEDEWSPFVRVALEWRQDSTTLWELSATSDFMSTAATESTSKRGISLTLRQQILTKIQAFAGATYEHLELEAPTSTRDDDLWRFYAGADYELTELFSLHGDFSWEDRDSSSTFATFQRTVARIGVQARF